MKAIILSFALLALWTVNDVRAQQPNPAPYKPMSEFQQDTLRYLTYNFIDNKARYVGHKFEEVLRDYKLPILFCTGKYEVFSAQRPGAVVTSVLIVYRNTMHVDLGIGTMYLLQIFFSPASHQPYPLFSKDNQGTPERDPYARALRLKDAIVSDITIIKHGRK